MRATFLGKLGVLLAAFSVPLCCLAGEMPSLKDLDLGEHVTGPRRTVREFAGHVVLIEFWNINISGSMSIFAELEKQQNAHSKEGLIVIASHIKSNTADAQAIKSVADEKGAKTISMYLGTTIKGVTVGNNVPYAALFDNTGKCAYMGLPGPGAPKTKGFADYLKECIEGAPAGALGDHKLVKLASFADALKNNTPPSAILKKALVLVNSSDAETADEAKYVVENLTTFGTKLIESADALKLTNPPKCMADLQQVAKDYADTDVGQEARKALAALKDDKEFNSQMRAWQLLEKMKAIDTKLDAKAKDKTERTSEKFRRRNADALRELKSIYIALKKQHPDSNALAGAEEIMTKYELLGTEKEKEGKEKNKEKKDK